MRIRFKTGAGKPRGARALQWPLWLVVAAGPAAAQETPSLPAVTVSGEGVAARDTPTLGKLPLALREIPQSVTVIGLERMREQNLQSLDDVMQQTPGITVQPYQLLTTAYYARGFKVDSFEQDGVPVLMGNMAASPQDMAVYERVEILRGANGLLHGAGNPAATVNLVRKRQREFAFGGSVSAGSWDRYRAEADLGGPLNDSGSVRAASSAPSTAVATSTTWPTRSPRCSTASARSTWDRIPCCRPACRRSASARPPIWPACRATRTVAISA